MNGERIHELVKFRFWYFLLEAIFYYSLPHPNWIWWLPNPLRRCIAD